MRSFFTQEDYIRHRSEIASGPATWDVKKAEMESRGLNFGEVYGVRNRCMHASLARGATRLTPMKCVGTSW